MQQQTDSIHIVAHDSLSDPDICAECARSGATSCCYNSVSDDITAPLSETERQYILSAVPWASGIDFAVAEENSSAFITQIKKLFGNLDDDVVENAFPEGGWHYRLAVNNKGKCVLLGASGCLLPRQVRPLFCKLFPFWFTGPQLQVFGYEKCLALQTVETVSDLCTAMRKEPDQLSQLYSRLRQAWGLSHPKIC